MYFKPSISPIIKTNKMKIKDFELERYFAVHEFTAKHLLSSSDCDGYPMDYILKQANPAELEQWNTLTLGYTESKGNPGLRELLLNEYQVNNIDHIAVSSPGELNFICMNVLLDAGDHVITVSPGYQSLHEISISLGCELSYWKPNPENWHFEIQELKKLIRSNTKLLVINFPHNPTGSYLKPEELQEIIVLARQHGIYIFSDEMYHKLIADESYTVLPPIANLYERGISLWGTSKTFGLAGLRTGWIASQDLELVNKVVAFKDYLSICNSAPAEILTMIALNHQEAFLAPNLEKIRKNIVLFKAFSQRMNGLIEFIAPKAGSTAFVKLNIPESAYGFSEELVAKTGIMTVPAKMFGYEDQYIRVGFGRTNFPEILSDFESYLQQRY